MLKIKDSVDLKELEKYGFYNQKPCLEYYFKEIRIDTYDLIQYTIATKNRIIQINTYDGYDEPLDNTIYDLIKADLVEKVEE